MSHNPHVSNLEPTLRVLYPKLSSHKSKTHHQSSFGWEYWTAVALAFAGVFITHLIHTAIF